jgi:hypothetical protein
MSESKKRKISSVSKSHPGDEESEGWTKVEKRKAKKAKKTEAKLGVRIQPVDYHCVHA